VTIEERAEATAQWTVPAVRASARAAYRAPLTSSSREPSGSVR
jgi:hypothetical protein